MNQQFLDCVLGFHYLPPSFLSTGSKQFLNHILEHLHGRPHLPALHPPPRLACPRRTVPTQHQSRSIVQHRPTSLSKSDISWNHLLYRTPQNLNIHITCLLRVNDIPTKQRVLVQRNSSVPPKILQYEPRTIGHKHISSCNHSAVHEDFSHRPQPHECARVRRPRSQRKRAKEVRHILSVLIPICIRIRSRSRTKQRSATDRTRRASMH